VAAIPDRRPPPRRADCPRSTVACSASASVGLLTTTGSNPLNRVGLHL
jgi:hypothetical protein